MDRVPRPHQDSRVLYAAPEACYCLDMLPKAISLRNYRSFADPVTLELRPVTLLYGVNNSGKSALLRALPLLSASVEEQATHPLDLTSPVLRGASFRDLQWRGKPSDEQHPYLEIGLEYPDLTLRYGLNWMPEWRRLLVEEFELHRGEDTFKARWGLDGAEQRSRALTYLWSQGEDSGSDPILFRGLRPSEGPGSLFDGLDGTVSALDGAVQWLGSVRAGPQRTQVPSGLPMDRIQTDGADADRALESDPDLLERVSAWYERHLGRTLVVRPVGAEHIQLSLESPGQPWGIAFPDVGEGLSQVLSVLTALELARVHSQQRPRILAIEEPESHLNPKLQRALAETITGVVASANPPRLVLETHSQHLMTALQLEVALGHLRPSDAAIYWVTQDQSGRSHAELVELDEQGRLLGSWPEQPFGDLNKMARELLNARRRGRGR